MSKRSKKKTAAASEELSSLHDTDDADEIREALNELQSDFECLESCESMSDYRANLEAMIANAQRLQTHAANQLAATKKEEV